MIGWLQPSALWGLTLLAVPAAIHLLRPRRARRLAFPTIRFVRPSRTAVVRLGPPSDLLLLALRMGIVLMAVLAAAQPIWLSSDRLAAWNGRVARAVVVDTSASMRTPRADGRTAADEALAAADAEPRGDLTWRVDHPDLREGVRRALAWLRTAPPARREIVVISDFHHGSLSRSVVNDLPEGIGLRFIAVQRVSGNRVVDGTPLLTAPGMTHRSAQVEISTQGTQVTLMARESSSRIADAGHRGLRLVHAGPRAASERLIAVLAAAGTVAPDPTQPIAVRFAPVSESIGLTRLTERWMIDTVFDVERSAELARLGRESEALALPETMSSTTLLQDGKGRPLVRAAALGGELILDVAAPISSYFAASLTRAALGARHRIPDPAEQEVFPIPDRQLSSWTRAPGPVGSAAWRRSERSDARWLWLGALVLLLAESWLRSAGLSRKDEARVAA